jgi:hypothetical protein
MKQRLCQGAAVEAPLPSKTSGASECGNGYCWACGAIEGKSLRGAT